MFIRRKTFSFLLIYLIKYFYIIIRILVECPTETKLIVVKNRNVKTLRMQVKKQNIFEVIEYYQGLL